MHVDIESTAELEAHLAAHGDLRTVVVQALDLRDLTDRLRAVSGRGATFLGCRLDPSASEHLRETGAVILPELGDRPYEPYRSRLYTPEELLEGYEEGRAASYFESSRDARIYAWYQGFRRAEAPAPILEALAQRLHDHAIDDAKHDLLRAGSKRCVAIMGGHATRRDAPDYRQVVEAARALARAGYFLVSGGGPGAMEATHLGAWLAPHDDGARDLALEMLSAAPTYRDAGWFDTALEVKRRWPSDVESLAVPTWFYGHEPTNLFATHVAKYFSNALREDGLLAIATHGVVFAPGSAGTVQEIFMDACQNHYGTFEVVSPMVFLDARYWREQLPVAPLLEALASGRQYRDRIAFVDDALQAVELVRAHPPAPYVP